MMQAHRPLSRRQALWPTLQRVVTLVAGAASAGLALLAAPAMAGTVQMTVLNAEGRPAADVVVLVQPTAAWTAQPLPPTALIEQRDIRFVPYVTVVPVGASVRFTNNDDFDHHVRSQPGGPLGSVAPAKEFEFRIPAQRKGNNVSPELKLDVAGTVVLGCHLHNSMRGHIFIANTPWFGVSDANGQVRISNVPDGQAELRIWHPDQLTEQAAQRVQVAGTVVSESRLNFNPRRRPPPRNTPRGEYN